MTRSNKLPVRLVVQGLALCACGLAMDCGGREASENSDSSTGGQPTVPSHSSGGTAKGGTSVTGHSSSSDVNSRTGGTTSTGGMSAIGGTSSSGGMSATGGTTSMGGASSSGGTSSTTMTPVCPAVSHELSLVHSAQMGGSGFTGTTTIAPDNLNPFRVDAIKLKACFDTVGEIPAALSASDMKIYHAALEGGSHYIDLTSTPIALELTGINRFCFVFDLTSAPTATELTVSKPAALKYNWSFDSSGVTGLSIDTRPGHNPTISVDYDSVVADCEVL